MYINIYIYIYIHTYIGESFSSTIKFHLTLIKIQTKQKQLYNRGFSSFFGVSIILSIFFKFSLRNGCETRLKSFKSGQKRLKIYFSNTIWDRIRLSRN